MVKAENIRVLCACEESQAVTIAFRERGFEAYSNDVQDQSGGHPEWHLKMDCFEAIKLIKPTLMIAFPPCTHLAVSGARHFEAKRKDGRQQEGIDFFMRIINAPIKHLAVENPVGIMSSLYRKPQQIIQPFWFGDAERKTTCLWLKNLPLLKPTNVVEVDFYIGKNGKKYTNIHNGMGVGWNTGECKKLRSKTFPGIAKALAEQYGNYLLTQ